jgi:hypothetical protein
LTAFGTKDVQLIIDKNNLATGTWDTSKITVKSSAWGWSEVTLKDDGSTNGDATANDGKFTLNLSAIAGAGKPYPHTGLKVSGENEEFVFVFNGVEYKDASGNCNTTGVSAGTRSGTSGSFTPATVNVLASNKNTYITTP